MKGKAKAWLSGVLAVVLALAAVFFAACGKDEPQPDPGVPDDVTVVELTIDEPPDVTEYYIGESFDPTGMKIKAKWSDGVKLPVNIADCTIEPSGPLAEGDREVTISYGGKSVVQQIMLRDETIASISVDTGNAALKVAVGTPMDLSGLVVTAHYADGGSRVISGGYTVDVDGEPVDDLSELVFDEWGSKTLTVTYGDRTATVTLEIFDGFIIEAENIIESAEVTDDDKNFVEKVTGTFYAFSKPNEPASGGAYMGAVFNGDIMRFHIWAEEECYADVILRASSSYMLVDGGAWSPMEMGDMQFNRLFEVGYGSAADAESDSLEPLYVEDDVVLKGGKTEQPGGDPLLYVNWMDVNFGTLPLAKGDNIIELKVVTDYVNCRGENVACNIDRLEVQYTDNYTPPATAEQLTVKTPPTKTEYRSGEKFDPTGLSVEARMSDGTTRTPDISELTITPSGSLTTADEYVTISWREASVTQSVTVLPAESVTIEGENIIAEPTAEDKNYVEGVRNGYQGSVGAGATEAPGVADASGGAYLKGLFGSADGKSGAIARFHIWSDSAARANIKLYVSSCDVETSGDGNAWHPSVMNDVVFNDVFAVRVGTDGDLKDATPGDDVIVEGGRTEDGSVSMALWENWREIDLGTFDLAAGDNIVELENINSALTNLAGEIFGLNVDKLVVEFV